MEAQQNDSAAFFRSKDSIMEPELVPKMKQFIAGGGQPQVVVKLLTENYRGLAELSNLLCHWLGTAGLQEEEVNAIVDDSLKELVLQTFDPKRADTIFRKDKATPLWLDEMIKQQEWRGVIYNLAETYHNCLLLSFAIQRISDQGHQTEIAALATASTYFRVFNRVLKDSLEHICSLDEISLPPVLADFKKMCTHSQHTYLYTQTLIRSLLSHPQGYNLKRLYEELEHTVIEEGKVTQWMSWLLSALHEDSDVAESIASMAAVGSTNPSDIIKLYNAFSQANPPDPEPLRNPLLFELLIKDLFHPVKTINPAHKSKYFFILAYAASIGRSSPSIVDHAKKELQDTIAALEVVQPICQRNSFGSELQASVQDLKESLNFPVVAMGILHWIKVNLTDPEYYTTSYNTLCIPIHLELLRDISRRYELQRQYVLEILVQGFETKTGLDALPALELRRNLLDNIVHLMSCGYVLPVMGIIEKWATKMDQSLIRYFIVQLLDLIEPPYSVPFLSSLLRILELPTSIDALKSLGTQEKINLILSLIDHCLTTDYSWDSVQRSSLLSLKTVFAV